MTGSTEGERRQPKLLGTPSLKIRIALGSALLLVLGAWLAPRAAPTPLSAPQERAAPLLGEQVQARETVRPFRGIQDAAARLEGRGVAIVPQTFAASVTDYSGAEQPRESGFGVFVSDVYVLTHTDALDGRRSPDVVTAAGQRLPANVVAHEPATGLVLLDAEPSRASIDPIAVVTPEPGTLAVAAGPSAERHLTVPVFVTSVSASRYTIGGLIDAVLPGMPVYTLDGELFAIAAGNAHGDAYPVRAAADRLMARAASGDRAASFGLGFQALSGALTRIYGEAGVLINHVVEDGPADRAGIRAGDVLVAVGEREIESTETASDALSGRAPAPPTPLRVRRNGRERMMEATPAPSFDVAALARASDDSGGSLVRARDLWPRMVLDQAAIPPSARVLALSGRPVTSRALAERDLQRARSAVSALLQHGDTRFFVAIETAR